MNRRSLGRRVYFTTFILLVLFVSFSVKLFRLHFSDKIKIQEDRPLSIGRGTIYDRSGYILASSIALRSVFANPSRIEKPAVVARKLASLLPLSSKFILKRLLKKKKFVWIMRKCDDATANRVAALGIKGIGFRKEYKRVYPYKNLASNILGFVGLDNRGLAGIEYKFDDLLSGRGDVFKNEAGKKQYGKKDIYLTIDRFIQHCAESELNLALEKHHAKQGAILVMDIKTGKLLAMAKAPGFDPNRYRAFPAMARKNFSIVDSYEPGSTMKVLSMASVLGHKPGVLKKKFFCRGYKDIADVRIKCLSKHGEISPEEILRHSCNAGMIQASQQIKKSDLFETYSRLGFGKKTGIELPGESAGILRPVSKWSGLSRASMSIGHEISVTSVQLLAAFSAIANGGIYNIPTIIERIDRCDDGKIVRQFRKRSKGRVLGKDISKLLMEMMRSVVKDGTGHRAASKFYETLGKTGTSQKFARSIGEYTDRNISSFVGIAPYKSPQIAVLVIIDDPEDRFSGGAAAAPVFAKLVDRILPYLGEGRSTDSLKIGRTPPSPLRKNLSRWPDFSGMDMADLRDFFSATGRLRHLSFKILGKGKVYRQSIAPGKKINDKESIVLYMK